MKTPFHIDQNTKVSMYLVGVSIPFVVSAVFWFSSVSSEAKEAKAEVKELSHLVLEIHDSIIRIETILKKGK